jgi:hypothetical protein
MWRESDILNDGREGEKNNLHYLRFSIFFPCQSMCKFFDERERNSNYY